MGTPHTHPPRYLKDLQQGSQASLCCLLCSLCIQPGLASENTVNRADNRAGTPCVHSAYRLPLPSPHPPPPPFCTLHDFNQLGFATECQAWCLALPRGRLFLGCLPRKRNWRLEKSKGIGSLTPVTSTRLHLAPSPRIRTFHVTAQHVIMSGHRV